MPASLTKWLVYWVSLCMFNLEVYVPIEHFILVLLDVGSCIIVWLLLFVLKEKVNRWVVCWMYDLQDTVCTVLYGSLQFVRPLKAGFFFSKRNDLSNDVHFFAVLAFPMLRHFGGCKYDLRIIVCLHIKALFLFIYCLWVYSFFFLFLYSKRLEVYWP